MEQYRRGKPPESAESSHWANALAEGRFTDVIQGAQQLRAQGCVGAFHLQLLGTIAQRTTDSIEQARKLARTIALTDLYERAPELLESGSPWIDATSWFLHHEFGRGKLLFSGERLEALVLGELGIFRAGAKTEEAAAFKALSLIRQGNLDDAFDSLHEASLETPAHPPQGAVFRRAGHTLFNALPRSRRLDMLRYQRGKDPRSYGLAPFPGRGFLIKEYLGGAPISGSTLLARTLPTLSPILTAGWLEGWTRKDGFPETESFARVESLLLGYSRAS